MRPSALAAVALVAAALGASAVLVVGSLAGWLSDDGAHPHRRRPDRRRRHGRARAGLGRGAAGRQRLRPGPDLRQPLEGRRHDLLRSSRDGQRSQGSGFVVSADGTCSRTPMSSRTRARADRARPRPGSTSSSRTATAFPARSSAGTSSTTSASSRSTRTITPSRRCRSATRAASSSASRSPRSAARSGGELARGRRRLRDRALDRVPHLRLRRLGRDPDRRADQPRQLRRPAARRPRPRDRAHRPDPLRLRQRGGRRLRDPDQRGQALDGAVDLDGQGRLCLRRRDDRRTSRRRSRAAYKLGASAWSADPVRGRRTRRPRGPGCTGYDRESVQRRRRSASAAT